jgi:hypothetical protein
MDLGYQLCKVRALEVGESVWADLVMGDAPDTTGTWAGVIS